MVHNTYDQTSYLSKGWSTSLGKTGRVGVGQKRRLQGHLIVASQNLKGTYKIDNYKLFSPVCCKRTRPNGFKSKEDRVRLETIKKLFTVRILRHWYKLAREVGTAPSLKCSRPGRMGP